VTQSLAHKGLGWLLDEVKEVERYTPEELRGLVIDFGAVSKQVFERCQELEAQLSKGSQTAAPWYFEMAEVQKKLEARLATAIAGFEEIAKYHPLDSAARVAKRCLAEIKEREAPSRS